MLLWIERQGVHVYRGDEEHVLSSLEKTLVMIPAGPSVVPFPLESSSKKIRLCQKDVIGIEPRLDDLPLRHAFSSSRDSRGIVVE